MAEKRLFTHTVSNVFVWFIEIPTGGLYYLANPREESRGRGRELAGTTPLLSQSSRLRARAQGEGNMRQEGGQKDRRYQELVSQLPTTA